MFFTLVYLMNPLDRDTPQKIKNFLSMFDASFVGSYLNAANLSTQL